MPGNFETLFKETWGKIEVGLDQVYDVLQGKGSSVDPRYCKSAFEWHEVIYEASSQDELVTPMLYLQLQAWLHSALEERVAKPILAKCKNTSHTMDDIFREVSSSQRQFKVFTSFSKAVFHHVGSDMEVRTGGGSIEAMYLRAYNLVVVNQVKEALRTGIIRQVNACRDGELVDMTALKAAVGIFVDVGTATAVDNESKEEVYSKDFETHYFAVLEA